MTNSCKAALSKAGRPIQYLTKSLFKSAVICPRKLVYATKPGVYPRQRDIVDDPIVRQLSEEGKRFGKYCQSLFPHAIEIIPLQLATFGSEGGEEGEETNTQSEIFLGDRVSQTRRALIGDNESENDRVTLFEGAVTFGNFYVQPDILDKIIHPTNNADQHNNDARPATDSDSSRIELRVIEVKSKSWDSRHSIESKIWNKDKKSIKSTFLPYIQDVAFQTMVVRSAFPAFHVTSWLMMPDKAKRFEPKSTESDKDESDRNGTPMTVQDTIDSVDKSIAALLNVDELVEKALSSKLTYPGGAKTNKFKDVVEQWAMQMNEENFGLDNFNPPPIGTACGSCEYRLRDGSVNSGFDICWKQATGLSEYDLQNRPLVIDLHGSSKTTTTNLISQKKYFVTDLEARDFASKPTKATAAKSAAGTEEDKDDKINAFQRQWYQVLTARNATSESDPQFILRKDSLHREMSSWEYPLHFIDFETACPIIPYYYSGHPYAFSAFQFSHHKMVKNDDGSFKVHHATEFLHTESGINPNAAFTRALLEAVGNVSSDGGCVFRWSAHENTVLSSMLSSPECSASLSAEEHAALAALLSDGSHPMVDLCKLAQDYFYVDGSGGSSSIKRLLTPTLNASTHLQKIYGSPSYNGKNFRDFQWFRRDESGRVVDPYELLLQHEDNSCSESNAVAHGIAAAAAFHELQCNADMSTSERNALQSSLLRYCELDTLAMVMIVQAWQGFLGSD